MMRHFRLVWLSDLHLNMVEKIQIERFLEEIRAADPDAIVITGDISVCGGCGATWAVSCLSGNRSILRWETMIIMELALQRPRGK